MMRTSVLILCLGVGLFSGPAATRASTVIQKHVPVRFSFESGNGNLDADSDWDTLVPYWSQYHAYVKASSIPYGFTASAYLVFSFDSEQVYPGNTVICSVWMEPLDADGINELYSDYGFELGVEFRNYWVDEVTLGIAKDFRLNIQGNGPLPLGDTLLGGMDFVDFASIPLDELLPGSSQAVKVLQGFLKVADYSNLGIGSISLGGEVVVEGNYLKVYVGDRLLEFTQYGAEHAQTANISVPVRDYSAEDFVLDLHPVYNASLYKTVAAALTLIEPLSLPISPTMFSRLSNILPGNYEPPSVSFLHSGPYQKAVDGVGLEADTPWVSVTFPVNRRPDLPDLVVHDIAVNPENGWGLGRAYADEITCIRYSVGNFGERATQANAHWVEWSKIDAAPMSWIWLNNRGFAPHLSLDVNAVTQLCLYAYFTNSGMHTMYLSTGYMELKGLDGNGAPVYGLGDGNLANNVRTFSFYVRPPRGTIIGRLMTNPDYPESGVNGVPVRLTDAYGSQTVVSGPSGGENGIYRFDRVPGGEVTLEYLPLQPDNPKDPDYWPRSFHFTHQGGDTDDFRERGGMYMLQYQTFSGRVRDAGSPGAVIPGTQVQFGDKRFDGTESDGDGLFTFSRIPPRGTFILVFDHPEFAVKRILVTLAVEDTDRRASALSRYYDYETDEMVDLPYVQLRRDETAPTAELFPFASNVCTGILAYAFRGLDDGGTRLPSAYRTRVYNLAGGVVWDGGWVAYEAPTGTLDRVSATCQLMGLAQGSYRLDVAARDPAGNVGVSSRETFTIDRTPPVFTVAIAGGAAGWQQWAAPVTVTLSAAEPGDWFLELSSDGFQWDAPVRCGGGSATVREWPLVEGRIEAAFTATVYARVTDGAGLTATGQDTIEVDLSGLVQLAYGYDYWFTTNVPLNIRLLAPDGDLLARVATYVDQLDIGKDSYTRFLAQTFVLTGAVGVSRVKLGCQQVVGNASDLHIKVVPSLSDAQPAGSGVLTAWSGSADDVRLSEDSFGFLYADFPKVTLSAGTYYLLLYTDGVDTNGYYRFNAGNTLYGGNGWSAYTYTNGHWRVITNAVPGIGSHNLQFSLYTHDAGEMRLATDGACDTEAWVPFTSPFPEGNVVWPTQGLHTVAFEYRHPTKHEKDGTYYDSVVLDWTPPVVHSAAINHVDTERRLLYVTADVSDAFSPVALMYWRILGGGWQARAFEPEFSLPIEWLDWIEVCYEDRMGNVSGAVPVVPSQDFLPPTVTLTVANGAGYVDRTKQPAHLVSADNFRVAGVYLRERRTGTDYGVQAGGDVIADLMWPEVPVPDGERGEVMTVVDGEYIFTAQAFDETGHLSDVAESRVVLDRAAPQLLSVSLTGPSGEAVTMNTQMVMRIEARDVIGPMQARTRVVPQAWGAWSQLQNGCSQIPLAGPGGVLSYAAEVEVRDAVGHTVAGSASIRVNRRPSAPTVIRPAGYCGPSPFVVASPFSDPDGDARGAVEFIFFADGRVALQSGELESTDRYQTPPEWLELGGAYTCRARYRDAYGAWSEWGADQLITILRDQDHDGIADIVEQKGGTDPENSDSDFDDIPDGLEDFNLNGQVDPGESDPRQEDSDGDGLPDSKEDVDRDGELDPGETSPALADSDGDGMEDGDELYCGTDPCDGAAYFHFSAILPTPTPGGLVVRWIGRAGRTYQLFRVYSLDPAAPWEFITQVRPSGGEPPWYAVPVEVAVPLTHMSAWFRVIVFDE